MLRWAFITAVFCASTLLAQEKVTIEGSVLDDGTNLPVPGAKVTLSYSAFSSAIETTDTDASGTFCLAIKEAGTYVVEASAPGFQDTRSAGPAIQVDEGALDSEATPAVHRVTLRLIRSAAIHGRVRDGDSMRAISQLTVRALRLFWMRGKRQLQEERIAFTDDDGAFRLETLPAGEYLIEISKHTPDRAEDKASPKRYPILLWPGGDPDTIQPINLTASSEFSAGTINYSKLSLPRLHLKIAQETCPRDLGVSQVSLDEFVAGGYLNRQITNLTCSSPVTVGALSPGRYRLQSRFNGLTFVRAVEVKLEEGTDTDLELKAGEAAPITGKITCDCKTPLMDGWKMQVSFEAGETRMTSVVEKDGAFKGTVIFAETARIDVQPLPPGMYVKQVRYNGADRGQFIALSQDVPAWLEITLSDRPAGITGTATRDGKPDSVDHVIVARWPLVPDSQSPYYVSAEIDQAGGFKIPDLAPGTYRVAAVGPVEWARRNAPDAVASWLKSALEIKLSEDQISSIALEARLQ